MIVQLFEDITVDPVLLNGLQKQIAAINTEINRAFQLREKSDLEYMKEIAKKFNSLIINGQTIPFKLVIGADDSALADYDMGTKEISYYWGNTLKRIDPSVIHHEAIHHLQMENLIDQVEKRVPSKRREEIRRELVNYIVNRRKNQEKLYDKRFGKGATYDHLYFSTAKELVNYADKIALDFTRYMQKHKDWSYYYKIKAFASDFDTYKKNIRKYSLDFANMSKFYDGVTRQFAYTAKELFPDSYEDQKQLYRRLYKKLLNYITLNLENYIKGQGTIDTLESYSNYDAARDEFLSEKDILSERLAVPKIDMNDAFATAERVKKGLLNAIANEKSNKALYQRIMKDNYYKHNQMYIIPIKKIGYKLPVVFYEIKGDRPAGVTGRFGNFFKEPAIGIGLILDHKNQTVVSSYRYYDTIDHEVTHVLQEVSVALRYLETLGKEVDDRVLKKTIDKVMSRGVHSSIKGSKDALKRIQYYRKPNEMGARAMLVYKYAIKDEFTMRKLVSYIERNRPDFFEIDRMLKQDNVAGYRDLVKFSQIQMADTGDIEEDTAGWQLRKELLTYFYKFYQTFYNKKGVENAYM